MHREKFARALSRLEAGRHIYQMPSGQWRFGGNKFVPGNVATSLPTELMHVNNRGWGVYRLDPDYRPSPIEEG